MKILGFEKASLDLAWEIKDWETRAKKMSDEEHDAYIDEHVEKLEKLGWQFVREFLCWVYEGETVCDVIHRLFR